MNRPDALVVSIAFPPIFTTCKATPLISQRSTVVRQSPALRNILLEPLHCMCCPPAILVSPSLRNLHWFYTVVGCGLVRGELGPTRKLEFW